MNSSKSSPRRRAGWSKVCAAAFAATLLAIGASADGQVFNTNFDEGLGTYPQPRGSLSGQNGWDTNDAIKASTAEDVGQTDYVGPVNGYNGSSAANYQGALGGYFRGTTAPTGSVPSQLPGLPVVYLYHAYSPGAAPAYVFNTDFNLSYPTTQAMTTGVLNTTRDSFGFNFQTSGLANLFSVNFTPDLSNNGNSANQMIIGYSVNGVQTIPPIPGASAVLYNGIYHLRVNVNVTLKTMTINITGQNSYTSGPISLSSINPADLQQVAATWTLTNTAAGTIDSNGGYTQSGSNALYFDNFSIAVPEPSTWAMLGLGAVVAVGVARRRARA